MLFSERDKFYFWFWQQRLVRNGISWPQTHRDVQTSSFRRDGPSLTATSTGPARKWGRSDSFWRTWLFPLHPRKQICVPRLFMSSPHVMLWRETQTNLSPLSEKRPAAQSLTNSSITLSCLTLLWKEKEGCYLYPLCLFKRLWFKIKQIKFPGSWFRYKYTFFNLIYEYLVC